MKKQLGTALFSNITKHAEFNGQSTGKYELTIVLDEGQAADAQANGLQVMESEYNGETQYKVKFKSKFKLGAKDVVDRQKRPYVDELGNIKEVPKGSRVLVFTNPKPYTMMGKSGVTNYLAAIQVIEEATSVDFEDFDEAEEEHEGEY